MEQFIASHPTPPEEIVLDFDATDDPVHGQQEGRFFHGYPLQALFARILNRLRSLRPVPI